MSRHDQHWPVQRPSLDQAVEVLTRTDDVYGIYPAAEELDVAEAIRHTDASHQGGQVCDNPTEPDPFNRTWGTCAGCGQVWPCRTWTDAQALAVLYAGRAHNRYRQRAAAALDRARAAKSEVAS